MSVTQNAAYFEAQLEAAIVGLNNPEVTLLASDMVVYANSIIPPGENQTSKPRPGEPRSDEFRQRIDQLSSSISPELTALFNDFLAYIKSHESPSSN